MKYARETFGAFAYQNNRLLSRNFEYEFASGVKECRWRPLATTNAEISSPKPEAGQDLGEPR
jgi:hypothetical protein